MFIDSITSILNGIVDIFSQGGIITYIILFIGIYGLIISFRKIAYLRKISKVDTTEIFGVVGMASKSAIKDNFQALLRKENYSKGVVIKTLEDGRIAVDVYTVMSYGVKISEVSRNIQERVKFNLESQLGISVDAVNVFIQNIKVVGE